MLYNGLIKVSILTVIILLDFDRIYILEKRCIGDMMKFRKRDSRKMLKEIARLRGLSVSEVRGQIQDAILEAKNSDDPDQQAEFQRLFGDSTPTPEEFICTVSGSLKF